MTQHTCPVHGPYERAELAPGTRYPANLPITCRACAAGRRAREEALQAQYDRECRAYRHWCESSGIPARNRNRTLENWTPRGVAQQLAGKIIRRYVDTLQDSIEAGDGLTLSGPPGVGKTHLATALVSAAAARGCRGHYISWPDAVERHKATFGRRDVTDAALLAELQGWPLLAIDEIGIRTSSEFERGLLFELIDARYRDELATVVATNLTADQLDTIGERTADRLREMNATVVIPGASQRTAAATDAGLRTAPWAMQEPEVPSEAMQVSIEGEMADVTVTVRRQGMGW